MAEQRQFDRLPRERGQAEQTVAENPQPLPALDIPFDRRRHMAGLRKQRIEQVGRVFVVVDANRHARLVAEAGQAIDQTVSGGAADVSAQLGREPRAVVEHLGRHVEVAAPFEHVQHRFVQALFDVRVAHPRKTPARNAKHVLAQREKEVAKMHAIGNQLPNGEISPVVHYCCSSNYRALRSLRRAA